MAAAKRLSDYVNSLELTAEQNNKLVDYNNKLFMRVTTEPQPQQVEKPLTAEEAEEKEIAEIKKLMEERRIY